MEAGEGNKEERKRGGKGREEKKGGSDRVLLATLFDWLVAPCAM